MVFWYNFHCNVYAPSHLFHHYSDVIMRAMASQVTSLTIVYSTVYSGGRSKKTSKLRVTGLCEVNSPVTGEFTTQRASNAANVSIWWRHHGVMSMRNTCYVISALVVVETQIEKYMVYCELGLPRMTFWSRVRRFVNDFMNSAVMIENHCQKHVIRDKPNIISFLHAT